MDPYANVTPMPFPSAPTAPDASSPILKPTKEIGEAEINKLISKGFTKGLAQSLSLNKTIFPLRIWVVDNSGSMQKPDGHRVVTKRDGDIKITDCTRWEEIRECVNYHAEMAGLLESETWFRLLNDQGPSVGPEQFEVASSTQSRNIHDEVQDALNIMSRAQPGGVTPLTEHISEIYQVVESLRPQLEAEGKKVAIILATDGLPTNNQGYHNHTVKSQFVESLRRLEGLPVWLVIRLCTDEEDIVNFYNDLDEQLELSMDVLDDFNGEAEEVYEHNDWLNYTIHLHRIRELGFHDRVFDMIDERKLTKGELRNLCVLLFGMENFDGVPDPAIEWKGFLTDVKALLEKEKKQWNPIKKKMMPLLDLKKLDRAYGDGDGCAIM